MSRYLIDLESENMLSAYHADRITPDLHLHQRILTNSEREKGTTEKGYSKISSYA